MSGSAENPPELPRRLAGELDLPAPNKPMYFETRLAVLAWVRDRLEDYDPPAVKEHPSEDFHWMQPGEDTTTFNPIRGSDLA